jgi:hypothetical protein
MWSARAHEAKRMWLGVKHIFTNGEDCKELSLITPKCIPIMGVAFMHELQMFRTLDGKTNKHQIQPLRHH